MKFSYIGAKPVQKWGDNKGVLSTSDATDLRKEDKISKDYGLEFIEKKTFSNNILEFAIPEQYPNILVVCKDIRFGGGIKYLTYRVKFAGDSAFNTSNLYKDAHYVVYDANATPIERKQGGTSFGRFGLRSALSNTTGYFAKVWLLDFNRTNRMNTHYTEGISYYSSGAEAYFAQGAGAINKPERITEIQFSQNAGSAVTSGDIILYGLQGPRISENSLQGV